MSSVISWRAARAGLAAIAALGTALASVTVAAATPSGESPVRAEGDLAPIIGAGSQRAIKDRYMIVFDRTVDLSEVFKGRDNAKNDGGKIHFEYSKAVKGFAATLTQKAVDRLRRNPKVSYLEADERVVLTATQSSPPWGLDRIDQRTLPLSTTYNYAATAAGVTAYVIDTGIRTTHSQFGGRASSGFTAINDGNGTNDCNGHGTHVAGTIGGSTHGVAKAVKLVAVRVLDCAGSGTTSSIIAGVDWVTSNAVKPAVANMSLGGVASTSLDTAVGTSIVSGITYVAAGGNDNVDACTVSPARLDAAITVGATTNADARASFSNYGSCLDLFAPGATIVSTGHTSDTATATMSGTSMATPHVAGVAALYLQAYPTAIPSVVRDALVNNSSAGVVTNAGTGSPNRLLYSPPSGFATPVPAPAACPALPETYSGSLTRSGDYEDEPNGSFYIVTTAGTHIGCVSGPSGTNFDLYLYKKSGTRWVQVAAATSTSSTDKITYVGTTGSYKWRVISKAGSGSYTFRMQRP